MSTKRDYYEILGVPKTSTEEEIKKAYRKLAMDIHPDRAPADKKHEYEEKFKEISEAYAVLMDKNKRAQYDRFGHAGIDSRYSTEDIFRNVDFDSIFSDMGFGGSIFEDFFGFDFFNTGRRSRRKSEGVRGSDLRYDLTIDFEEAVRGKEIEITIPRNESCDTCKGSGVEPGHTAVTCAVCGGTGRIRQSQGFFSIASNCYKCGGSGKVNDHPCRKCRGSGVLKKERKLSIKIPAGVDDGNQLKISGEGEAGRLGGPPGNLYIFIRVRKHRFFDRRENDFYTEVSISMAQAALGTEILVPAIDGKQVKIKIPPGTPSGKIFRLKGLGVNDLHGYGKGDQFVRVVVEIPRKMNARQKQLLSELSKTLGESTAPEPRSFLNKSGYSEEE